MLWVRGLWCRNSGSGHTQGGATRAPLHTATANTTILTHQNCTSIHPSIYLSVCPPNQRFCESITVYLWPSRVLWCVSLGLLFLCRQASVCYGAVKPGSGSESLGVPGWLSTNAHTLTHICTINRLFCYKTMGWTKERWADRASSTS